MSYRVFRQRISSTVLRWSWSRRFWMNWQCLPAWGVARPFARNRAWSEDGEDAVLLKLAEGFLEDGFYVDVGANLPTKRSNTFRLYCHGMRGICVEPNLELASLFERMRPRDEVVCAAVGQDSGIACLHRFNYHVYSTCSEELGHKREESASARMRTQLLRKSSVPIVPLRTLLEGAVDCVAKTFFLLATDTEGFDLEVLRSNDWERNRPLYVLTESSGQTNEVKTFLEAREYRLSKEFSVNQLFACERRCHAG